MGAPDNQGDPHAHVHARQALAFSQRPAAQPLVEQDEKKPSQFPGPLLPSTDQNQLVTEFNCQFMVCSLRVELRDFNPVLTSLTDSPSPQ